MTIAMIVLNTQALATARRLQPAFPGARIFGLAGKADGADETYPETAPLLRRLFGEGHAIVGICAAGILIRALAPVLGDKTGEAPVVAVAADGSAVVPLLGGLTGGEPLAARIAAALGVRASTTAVGALGSAATPAPPRKGEENDNASGSGSPPPLRGRDRERGSPAGTLVVVGLGPGDPSWLTPEAGAALADAADLVGYDTYLAMTPVREGQVRHASDNREEMDRARHALALARDGRRVAVVSSGDPGIFAMAAALMEAVEAEPAAAEGIGISVVPGLSAMQAAAARAGAPLGHDFAVISLSDRLKPWDVIARRLDAAAAADFALALYNPASRERRGQIAEARDILLRHRAGGTPVVAARNVGRPGEAVTITTLAALDLDAVDMRTLLIVGSSRTRIVDLPDGRRYVYTPRRYDAGDER